MYSGRTKNGILGQEVRDPKKPPTWGDHSKRREEVATNLHI